MLKYVKYWTFCCLAYQTWEVFFVLLCYRGFLPVLVDGMNSEMKLGTFVLSHFSLPLQGNISEIHYSMRLWMCLYNLKASKCTFYRECLKGLVIGKYQQFIYLYFCYICLFTPKFARECRPWHVPSEKV